MVVPHFPSFNMLELASTTFTNYVRIEAHPFTPKVRKNTLFASTHTIPIDLLTVRDVVLGRQRAVLGNILDGAAVRSDPSLLAASHVVLAVKLGEAPLVGLHDFLSSGELELRTAESLNDVVSVGILGTHGHNDLADGDTGSHLHGLTVGVSHTGRQTIGSGARKHLILTNDVERVRAGSNVVAFLAGGLGKVLVAGHTGSLEGASGQLLLLVGHQVSNEGEHIDAGSLGSAVKNPDLGIGDTSAESRLNIRLVLLEAHAASRS